MSRKMEDYIREHKKAFDLEAPSDALWAKIEQQLDKKKKARPFNLNLWMGIAASLVLIAAVTFMFTRHQKNKQIDVADISRALGEKEARFANMIDEKKDSLKALAEDNPDLYQKFSADLNQLDKDYADLKKELQHSPNQKLVIEAMVQNLQIQLQIINQQLSVINEVNTNRKDNQI
ncbi:hypothetical protein [Pedobacter africanus]|uniref:Uncharacterized protein n=1 Tax=Pedobacter africanus TaxID=151894 RepID=A0A1W2B7U4_9SPHI|nr:hypothetical protein [Pedobacter africanus]SMC69093.1 hypothetical protein SAMN04488524_2058 [Pedobacter africanus]